MVLQVVVHVIAPITSYQRGNADIIDLQVHGEYTGASRGEAKFELIFEIDLSRQRGFVII